MKETVYGLSALLTLVPASVASVARLRSGASERDASFWLLIAVAVVGTGSWAGVQLGGVWQTGLSSALWIVIASCLILYAGLSAATRSAWKLEPLLLPYLLALGALAVITHSSGGGALRGGAPTVWIDLHIVVAVVTYALLTLGTVAALAAFLQERALKSKRPTLLTRHLPPLAEAERLQVLLLGLSELVLAAGLATGMAVLYFETGRLLVLDHKTLFSLATFALIGGLLVAHRASGIRGRRAARIVLVAYLMLTLGYIGVKFVTDILLA